MKTITEMAREAGLVFNEEHGTDIAKSIHLGRVQAFAELVRAEAQAEEREACAKVCDEGTALMAFQSKDCYSYAHNRAKAIRARGNT